MNDRPELFHPGPGQRGVSELHYAAYCGDAEALSRCLEAGADPNHADQYRGYTALHWLADMAAAGGDDRARMAEELLRHGADPTIKSSDSYTPVQLALDASGQGDEVAAVLKKWEA
ncbi:ankyrin repeat domain-containing protein [Dokdonella immobilis]|uniref:ankyrin repeat domain-containing protein n=1 Tax=Dokdonella immobilis TaxID=578942 RepID=UPI000B85D915